MVIELVEFRTRAEVRDETFAVAVADTTVFLKSLNGFRVRRLARGAGDLWLDYVEWDSMDDAVQAAESFQRDSSAITFNRCIVPGSASMRHFTVFHSVS